mmetsp:Transcript_33256/g.98888  ORF Transcript_33256/g.98888 Transcript_33256/m.98888 type:complete len:314 (-) Transcript_33256:118-1059(-)
MEGPDLGDAPPPRVGHRGVHVPLLLQPLLPPVPRLDSGGTHPAGEHHGRHRRLPHRRVQRMDDRRSQSVPQVQHQSRGHRRGRARRRPRELGAEGEDRVDRRARREARGAHPGRVVRRQVRRIGAGPALRAERVRRRGHRRGHPRPHGLSVLQQIREGGRRRGRLLHPRIRRRRRRRRAGPQHGRREEVRRGGNARVRHHRARLLGRGVPGGVDGVLQHGGALAGRDQRLVGSDDGVGIHLRGGQRREASGPPPAGRCAGVGALGGREHSRRRGGEGGTVGGRSLCRIFFTLRRSSSVCDGATRDGRFCNVAY